MTDICIAHGGDLGEHSGGTDRVSAIASGLAEQGHDVLIVAPTPGGQVPAQLSDIPIETLNIPTHGISTQPQRAYYVSRKALAVASRRDAKIQFEHSTLAGVGTLFGASGFVLDMHDLAFRSPLYGELPLGTFIQRAIKFLEQRAITRANSIIVVSEEMRDIVIDTWDIDDNNVFVVPNGYFEERVEPYRTEETAGGRIVFLGTLHPKLDVDAIFRIADLPEVSEFIVIGDGNLRTELEQASERHDSLRVAGRLPDEEAFKLVASASVVVNPQLPSGLQAASSPVKLYYYAALGVPAVVSAGPDLAAQLDDAGAAMSVSADGDFPETVRQILRSDNERERMAQRARRVAQELKWERRVNQFVSVYDRVLSDSGMSNRS
jgi:glycosyltransferase involved in cell wall biosynthesis